MHKQHELYRIVLLCRSRGLSYYNRGMYNHAVRLWQIASQLEHWLKINTQPEVK